MMRQQPSRYLLNVGTGLSLALLPAVAICQQPPQQRVSVVSVYPGSELMGEDKPTVRAFDEFELIAGPVVQNPKTEKLTAKTLHLEGKITNGLYRNPEGRSVLEVYRNYQQGLSQKGFTTIFECNGRECGEDSLELERDSKIEPRLYDATYVRRYLAAKLTRAEGDVYVAIAVQAQGPTIGGDTQLFVVEVKPMQSQMVSVDFKTLGADLQRTGHVAVYGIYFDTDKADLKPESEATLNEIARLLSSDPQLKLHVVGHTDNQGTVMHNLDLSKRRALAVLTSLTTRQRVASVRLDSEGVGPYAPVASNDSEEGRTKNRRVELVKQ